MSITDTKDLEGVVKPKEVAASIAEKPQSRKNFIEYLTNTSGYKTKNGCFVKIERRGYELEIELTKTGWEMFLYKIDNERRQLYTTNSTNFNIEEFKRAEQEALDKCIKRPKITI